MDETLKVIEPLLIERSVPGRRGFRFASSDVPRAQGPDPSVRREGGVLLPQASELDTVRHFTRLASMTFGVDMGPYPLGSCTMKYNPKLNEACASLDGFTALHPLQDEDTVQGALELMYRMQESLSELVGMPCCTLAPCAGAHGEYTGLKIIRSYFHAKGQNNRNRILIPVSAHGTNPASANVNGFEVVEVASSPEGLVDMDDLRSKLDENTAALMLTNPNTLGLFETDILEISRLVHEQGGLMYYDGANFNALMGWARPGDMGFDVVHLNLHKTFSTPHGGGGPGSGPVLAAGHLKPFVPGPTVVRHKSDGRYALSWGRGRRRTKVCAFWGNFLVVVRAYAYILAMGSDGLRAASTCAVLNANYLRVSMQDIFSPAYGSLCKHEFVLGLARFREETGVSALDIAKGLIDLGFHPPTMYFPTIVHEALMFEPTESESKDTLDSLSRAMHSLCETARTDAGALHGAPAGTIIGRVDEVRAVKQPVLRYQED